MWFKQIQIFQLPSSFTIDAGTLSDRLSPLAFTPCLPSLPLSTGWIPPINIDEENQSLVRDVQACLLFSLQFEEKILPASVINQHLTDRVKVIEQQEDRKIRQKEKLSLKDDIAMTLLPRAFTKKSIVSAYIDLKNHLLIINSTSTVRVEKFISMLSKSLHDEISIKPIKVDNIGAKLTRTLLHDKFPTEFEVEKKILLQDIKQENRIIRCQQQDLHAESIQSFIKDGCRVKQLALTWHDQISFTLSDNFTLQGLTYQDDLLEASKEIDAETVDQIYDANALIMTKSLGKLINDLLNFLHHKTEISEDALQKKRSLEEA